jgi:hypothetical protein
MKLYDLEGIDLALLHQQKQLLVEMIWDAPDSELWGVVSLLDSITDQMEDTKNYRPDGG